MEYYCAFFACGVPARVGYAVGARGAVLSFLEEGSDVVPCWEGDL